MDKSIIKKVQELNASIVETNKLASIQKPLGCYMTPDNTLFYRNESGLAFAEAHAQAGNVCEFDADAELVTDNVQAERTALLTKLAESPTLAAGAKDYATLTVEALKDLLGEHADGAPDEDLPKVEAEVDLNKMTKAELKALLATLDPTARYPKSSTIIMLRDMVERAHSLEDYADEGLLAIIRACDKTDADARLAGITDEKALSLGSDDLLTLALFVRDEVYLENTSEVLDRLAMMSAEDQD